jgi:hypothetical protein
VDLNAGVIIAILTHAAATIWWASKTNTTMGFILLELKRIADKFVEHDKELRALWRKVDEMNGSHYKGE